jgi:hypothetical protein
MQSTATARRHRAVGGTASEQEFEAMASAALLPLVSNNADIVHLVIKHYQWDLLLDKISYTQQKYEKILADSEDRMRSLIEEERGCWKSYWKSYGPSMENPCEEDRRNWAKCESEFSFVCGSIARHCAHVVAEFSLLKQDVASIKKFAHPSTSRNLRKTEVGMLKNSITTLLSSIDVKLPIYQGTQRWAQAFVDP